MERARDRLERRGDTRPRARYEVGSKLDVADVGAAPAAARETWRCDSGGAGLRQAQEDAGPQTHDVAMVVRARSASIPRDVDPARARDEVGRERERRDRDEEPRVDEHAHARETRDSGGDGLGVGADGERKPAGLDGRADEVAELDRCALDVRERAVGLDVQRCARLVGDPPRIERIRGRRRGDEVGPAGRCRRDIDPPVRRRSDHGALRALAGVRGGNGDEPGGCAERGDELRRARIERDDPLRPRAKDGGLFPGPADGRRVRRGERARRLGPFAAAWRGHGEEETDEERAAVHGRLSMGNGVRAGSAGSAGELGGMDESAWQRALIATVVVALALAVAKVVDRALTRRLDLAPEALTRYRVLRRSVIVAIVVVGVLSALLVIPEVRAVAGGVLASSAVAALVLGMAARSTLANFVAGILIAFTQPLRLGDEVEVGDASGAVEEIGLTYTVIRTASGERFFIPNEKLASDTIRNATIASRERLARVTIPVPLSSDLERVVSALEEEAKGVVDSRPDREPAVTVTDFERAASVAVVTVEAWAAPGRVAGVEGSIRRAAHRRLRAEGVFA